MRAVQQFPPGPRPLSALSSDFPLTIQAFSQLADGGISALSHIQQLDRGFLVRPESARLAVDSTVAVPGEFDVVLAGGGLSLFYAAYLSAQGLRVAVFDRRPIGAGHREWNVSRAELSSLVQSGLFSDPEVEKLVLMKYRTGVCRFADGPNYWVSGVLDCVVDADKLLSRLHTVCSQQGVLLLSGYTFRGYRVDASGVTVRIASVQQPDRERTLRARLLLDGLGALSPHARFDLCCPTVGGVMDGLQIGSARTEMDPQVGEILVTTEGIESGRQHIWEGFPTCSATETAADSRKMTVYLFYYLRTELLPSHGPRPLLSLYERYFATLHRYKRGPLRLVRPTYGYIPAYTRLADMPTAPRDRVLLVGDAAGRHSPLTFCGFGSMVRSFLPISDGIVRLLKGNCLDVASLEKLWFEPSALKVVGGLTLMMSPPLGSDGLDEPSAVNDLLNAAFSTLYAQGQEAYRRFLQDDTDAQTFVRFMAGAARKYPDVYSMVFRYLSLQEIAIWLYRLWQLSRVTRGAVYQTKTC